MSSIVSVLLRLHAREASECCRKMTPWQPEAAREASECCRKMAPWQPEAAREDK